MSAPGPGPGLGSVGRSVGRFGLVSGLGSGRFWAEVVLVHRFGVFRGFGFLGALLLVFAGKADLKISEEKKLCKQATSPLARCIDEGVGNRLWDFGYAYTI